MDEAPIEAKKAEIMKILEARKIEKNYVASFLMVTNILTENTDLWFTEGAKSFAEKAFGKESKNNAILLEKVMSRKKQVAPFLIKVYE